MSRRRSNNSRVASTPNKREHALSLSDPLIVGYMSVDGDRIYHSDLSQLKFFNSFPTSLSLDLNHNTETALKRTTDDNNEKITLLLKFLLDQQSRLNQQIKKPTFVSYRRTLISIMCNAFGTKEPLRIAATLFNNSIYLCSIETEEGLKKRKCRSRQELKFCAWGYKFEQYLLSDYPNIPPKIEKPVIENEEFSMYYTATLGSKHLLYGAQIDGLLATNNSVSNPPNSTDADVNLDYLRKNSYIELKTNRIIQNSKQERNFKRYKLLRCWCQCYLANLKGLLLGYRTDDGIIQHLQWLDTPEIVSYCKDVWNPKGAIDYLDYILSYIKSSFQNKNNQYSLQFDLCSDGSIIISNLEKDIILPNWYVEKYKF